ncbi:Ig-like domain-containing protein [Lysinibacillus xylanilyticus]|uniref:Ig-like domain-containing protein n=1 Tax=Lysinibacillus xylanilyticus TaxID=582475 RepID=UPI003D054C1E
MSLDRNVLELSKYRNDRLTATILPENKNENIIWTSSDESFATVDQFGNIRAIKEFVVTITAHIENTNYRLLEHAGLLRYLMFLRYLLTRNLVLYQLICCLM